MLLAKALALSLLLCPVWAGEADTCGAEDCEEVGFAQLRLASKHRASAVDDCDTPQAGKNFEGSNIKNEGGVDTAWNCRYQCAETPGCVGYTFVQMSPTECWLKSTAGPMLDDQGCGSACSSGFCKGTSPTPAPPTPGIFVPACTDNPQDAPDGTGCGWMASGNCDDCKQTTDSSNKCRDYNTYLGKTPICWVEGGKNFCFDTVQASSGCTCSWMSTSGDDCVDEAPEGCGAQCRIANYAAGKCPRQCQ